MICLYVVLSVYILNDILCTFCICGLFCVSLILKSSKPFSFILNMHICWYCSTVFTYSFLLILGFLLFWHRKFPLTYLQAHWFFPCPVQSTDETVKGILRLCLNASRIYFRFSISLLTLTSVLACCRFFFSLQPLTFWSWLFSNISAIFKSGSDACFSFQMPFFLPLGILCNIFWRLDVLHWVTRTVVSRLLVWEFMLIYLEVSFCLILAVAVVTRCFRFF